MQAEPTTEQLLKVRPPSREEVAALTAGIKQAEELVNSTREAAWKAEQTAAELQAAAAELAKEADVAGRLLELESELAHDQHDARQRPR